MATEVNIGSVYTLVDLMKTGYASNGRAIFVAETLARRNPIVREFPAMEANQTLTHVGGRQLSLPTVGKRAINEGVVVAAHKEVPITAPMSLYETASMIDLELLKLAGSGEAGNMLRQRKDAAFIEGMTQSLANDIINGTIGTGGLGFNGLATMFDSSTTYPNGDSTWFYNVLLNGGSSSTLASIWIVEPGPDKVCLIYPKNTMGGLEITDRGEQWVAGSAATKKYWAKVTQFVWRCGLFVGDERCVQRVANIEKTGTDYTFNEDKLIQAINQLPNGGEDPATRIYVNRVIKTQMEIRVKDKANVYVTNFADAFGVPVLRFRGIPVQVLDTLNTDETAIS